ncbi:putative Thermostable neutral protease NprT [Streptomyces aurantiacus JA 4570]|uniref:Putative Thermostable neutral protease NprT n=1 Tax=Streptomyces aurantiacus JA 4570 TaxID=1286094 RepID=S4ASA1_9ACTN|nr:putative Thermostable neutral protease NprT [Streptomyces aurantiacus JA 4570]
MAPADAVDTAAKAPPPSPGEVIPGQETATPALVRGIREQAPAGGSAATAARGHLEAKESRYRIKEPERDLTPLPTATAPGGQETVRLQQKHRGVPVLGGQYVVRMEKKNGERIVTGTSGKYFTELRTATEPGIGEDLAVERAVDAVRDDLNARQFPRRAAEERDGGEAAPELKGTVRGLVVLPTGPGVLTRHVTVRGTDPASGEPVLREVYIDARAGYPVLQYSGIKTFGRAAPSTAGKAAAARSAAEAEPREKGSGVKLDGKGVGLDVERDTSRELYVMRDTTRIPDAEGSGRTLSTWDARDKSVGEVLGQWPPGIQEFGSPAPAFGGDATDAGAVDAHWGGAQVFDYFKNKHGRTSLDGHGMAVNSLVGVTNGGGPYVNAFWDGTKMVYGNGDAEYRPLSAGLDVVGHEMTHGVVEHSAALVYAGQSGALNEAIADYFGNAIETEAYGIPANHPDAGLVGDRLCRTKSPRECAFRDLNDARNTAKHFLGVGFGTDNGGVHLNSTIFGGALWDARADLGATLTDKLVYRALTQYLTPLDGFTEGRAAVLAAAKDLGVPAADQRVLQRAFNAHGIVPGWELALGVDSDTLLERVNTSDTRLGAGGGWWAASKSNEEGSEPYSVWAGRADGTGSPKLMSPNDGRYHVNPATDGKTVVWQAVGPTGAEILARPLAGGPVKKLAQHARGVGDAVSVDGDVVTYQFYNHGGRRGVVYLSLKDPANRTSIGGGTYHRAYFPSASDGKVVYQEMKRVRAVYEWSTVLVDVATGERKRIQQAAAGAGLGPTGINGKHVFWLVDENDENDEGDGGGATALRRAGLDGSGVVDLSPEAGPKALNAYDLTVSDDAVTVGARLPDTEYRNETLAKLWQFAADGSPADDGTRRGRVSCNRGEQLSAAAVEGSQVVWLDATTGVSDVVTRARPTGRCG